MQVAVLILTGLTACIFDKDEPEFSLAPGSTLPDFSVTLIGGEEFTTDDLLGSETVNLLIVFFNTDCPDCRQDLPRIQTLYDEILRDKTLAKNTRLLCIAREENAPQILEYWTANELTLPVSPQPDRRIYNLFASSGIPRLYLAHPDSKSGFTVSEAYSPGNIPSVPAIISLLRR